MDTTYSTNRKLKRMFANILSIFAILAIALPATGSVSAQEPVFLESSHDGTWGEVNASGCDANGWAVDLDDRFRDVQIQVFSDGVFVAETVADIPRGLPDALCPDGGCGFYVSLWGLIEPGVPHEIRVKAYDPESDQWLDLGGTPLSLTCWGLPEGFHDGTDGEVNAAGCDANGWAVDPDDRFRDVQIQVYSDGEFVAETVADIPRGEANETCPDGTCGYYVSLWGLIEAGVPHEIRVKAYDPESNQWLDLEATPKSLTCFTPSPHFTVFPEWEFFDGLDWPDGATVTITVSGKPDCATSKDSWGYFFNGNFGEGCNVETGDTVTFTDGTTTRTHTVQNLSVTKVDQEEDIVKGTADAGAEVYVWPHATGQQQLAIANPQGKWNADFTGVYDLMQGDGGRTEIRDEMGNATAVDWYIPKSRIVASITEDWFYLQEFSPNTTLDFTVYEAQDEKPIWKGTATTDGSGFAWINAEGRWDLEPGNYLVVKDGSAGKDLVIEGFTFDVFNLTNGQLSGTAPAPFGRDVWVGIGLQDQDAWTMNVSTDETGAWIADFGTPVPSDYAWVAAQIFDDDGDASELRPSVVINWTLVITSQPDWVSSGITVSTGQSFTIEAFGLMNPCSDTYPNGADYCIFYTPLGADGVVPYQNEFGIFPGPGLRFMALLGRIGDGEPFYVGAGGTFTADQAGTLWFTPNDNLRTDNQGAYSVLVGLEP